MVLFHLHILSTFPMGVPMEWNVFMIFSTLFLFGAHGATDRPRWTHPAGRAAGRGGGGVVLGQPVPGPVRS